MNRVHLSLQGKGGIGKSLVCRLLAEYDQDIHCFDADPINHTLSDCSAINCERVELLAPNGLDVDRKAVDSLVDQIVGTTDDVLLDTGATSYLPLKSYFVKHQLLDLLSGMGKDLWLHYVLIAGQPRWNCIESLSEGLDEHPKSATMVVWENEYNGALLYNLGPDESEQPLSETPLWKANADRLQRRVVLERRDDMFVSELERYLTSGLTFREIELHSDWELMSRHRLSILKDLIWKQLDELFKESPADQTAVGDG